MKHRRNLWKLNSQQNFSGTANLTVLLLELGPIKERTLMFKREVQDLLSPYEEVWTLTKRGSSKSVSFTSSIQLHKLVNLLCTLNYLFFMLYMSSTIIQASNCIFNTINARLIIVFHHI